MKKILLPFFPILSFSFLTACAGSGNSTSDPQPRIAVGPDQNEVIAADGSNVQGNYGAEIWPMNTNLHFQSIGHVGITRNGDDFRAFVGLKYGPKGTRIKQALYSARRCPTLKDDLNQDAYIDIQEARAAIGKMLIPLDGDLGTQLGGSGDFPTVGPGGELTWSGETSFTRLFDDLKSPDVDPADELMKLGDAGLTLPGRIVLFQGVPETVALPETVEAGDGETPAESVPVGCAVLWKVEKLPGGLGAQ